VAEAGRFGKVLNEGYASRSMDFGGRTMNNSYTITLIQAMVYTTTPQAKQLQRVS
jgi:hypothetical protein